MRTLTTLFSLCFFLFTLTSVAQQDWKDKLKNRANKAKKSLNQSADRAKKNLNKTYQNTKKNINSEYEKARVKSKQKYNEYSEIVEKHGSKAVENIKDASRKYGAKVAQDITDAYYEFGPKAAEYIKDAYDKYGYEVGKAIHKAYYVYGPETANKMKEDLDRYGRIIDESLREKYNDLLYDETKANTSYSKAKITGTDVILRSYYSTKSKILGSFKYYGEEVYVIDKYQPNNSNEAILNSDIYVYVNNDRVLLSKGKAVVVLSKKSGGKSSVKFKNKYGNTQYCEISSNRLNSISNNSWYKIRRKNGQTGWVYGKFVSSI